MIFAMFTIRHVSNSHHVYKVMFYKKFIVAFIMQISTLVKFNIVCWISAKAVGSVVLSSLFTRFLAAFLYYDMAKLFIIKFPCRQRKYVQMVLYQHWFFFLRNVRTVPRSQQQHCHVCMLKYLLSLIPYPKYLLSI